MNSPARRLVCMALLCCVPLPSASFGAEVILAPATTQWKINDVTENKDLSGIACMKIGAFQRCIIAIDEGSSASIARMEGTEIRQERLVPLLPTTGDPELDAEGAAYDPETKFFYVVGSHGRKRHCCESNSSAFNLIRFQLNGSENLPESPVLEKPEISKPLEPALKSSDKVGPHVGLCLGTKPTEKQKKKGCEVERRQGANIEGIAIYQQKLYIGLRGPVHGRTAYLMRFDADGVFSNDEAGATIEVTLGSPDESGFGVRDLAAVKTGLLILSGPEDDEPGQAALFHLDPEKDVLTPLGKISGLAAEAKPEGLLVLEDSDQQYRVLIISDGVKNGTPAEYVIRK